MSARLSAEIAEAFCTEGSVLSCVPMGNGHINKTFLLTTDKARYTLQKINDKVFPDVEKMMSNVVKVTRHIAEKHFTVSPVPTKDGRYFYKDKTGGFYRLMTFCDGKVCEKVTSAQEMYLVGKGFGRFQADLNDFSEELFTVIENFHDTSARLKRFLSIYENGSDRKEKVADLCKEYSEFFFLAPLICRPLSEGRIPERVTHNDTKINNLVLDERTDEPVCVIDLDTVMKGSLLYDFGDAVRSGGTTAAEDEKDLEKIEFSLSYFEAFCQGFLSETKDSITSSERELLSLSPMVMTFECGLRFLTDYLEGDVYFPVSYPEHNLVRAAAQMALLKDMERKKKQTEKIINGFFAR